MTSTSAQLLHLPVDDVHTEGLLTLPAHPVGLVLFAHGSDSSRHDPHNTPVLQALHAQGVGTLVLDLLSLAETLDYLTRFDMALLTHRLLLCTAWARLHAPTQSLRLGYFGSHTGAAAALQAAASLGDEVAAVVSRGGRADLAGPHDLAKVSAPTLLLVGERDAQGLALNHAACAHLTCTKALSIVPGASALFEEAGALERVAHETAHWFAQHLPH